MNVLDGVCLRCGVQGRWQSGTPMYHAVCFEKQFPAHKNSWTPTVPSETNINDTDAEGTPHRPEQEGTRPTTCDGDRC